MGNCSGKGALATAQSIKTKLKVKKCGVPSIDAFVDKCNDIVEKLGDIVDPLAARNAKIKRLSGF